MSDVNIPLPSNECRRNIFTEVITRGNCMMCGKELTEGLFFCKECEEKIIQAENKEEIK